MYYVYVGGEIIRSRPHMALKKIRLLMGKSSQRVNLCPLGWEMGCDLCTDHAAIWYGLLSRI